MKEHQNWLQGTHTSDQSIAAAKEMLEMYVESLSQHSGNHILHTLSTAQMALH